MNDVDNRIHRVQSATAIFQKGIYHLFFVTRKTDAEIYAEVLRVYQCLYLLCLTHLLLDFSYRLTSRPIPRRLRDREQIDPASLITHSIFENRIWPGFAADHYLGPSSQNALDLHGRVVDARHNLIYRPFMLPNFWEDCTLQQFLEDIPDPHSIEKAFVQFWRLMIEASGEVSREIEAEIFQTFIFIPYSDRNQVRPTESLFMVYSRLLNPNDPNLIREIKSYRNHILDTESLEITISNEGRVIRAGEI